MRLPPPNSSGRHFLQALVIAPVVTPLFALWDGDTLRTTLIMIPIMVPCIWGYLRRTRGRRFDDD